MTTTSKCNELYGYKGNNTMEILQVAVCRKAGFLDDTYLDCLPDELLDLILKEVYREGMVMSMELPITIVFRETQKRGTNSKKMIYASANDHTRGTHEYVVPIHSNTLCLKSVKEEFRINKAPHTMFAFEINPNQKPYLNTKVRHTDKYFKMWVKHGMKWDQAAFFCGTVWLQVDRKKE